MKPISAALLCALCLLSCKSKKSFNVTEFLALSKQFHLLTEQEIAIAEVNIASVPKPDIRSVARICKKVNFQSATTAMNLDIVNPDSNFNYLKFFREQLSQRSKPNPKGAVFIENINIAKEDYKNFLRELYNKDDLSSSQYAKLNDKLRQEPVVYPFVVFEWIETMP